MQASYPGYLKLQKSGELKARIKKLYELLKECRICPRKCGVNRLKGERGFCRSGLEPIVSSFHPHFGEEPPISGFKGSGTIFFAHCSLRCVFCQNYLISHLGNGNEISVEKLAEGMLNLQEMGCHNINLVTPTHFSPQIVRALSIAIEEGLHIPLVYNCGGYEAVETLRLLEGIIDIYMPDMKYGGKEEGEKYSSASDYFEVAKKAVKEMFRQVGNLKIDRKGIAYKGLLIRHLILPHRLAKTRNVFEFIAKEISPLTYISLMSQYFPAYKAQEFRELNRKITQEEYKEALNIAKELGLKRGWQQEYDES